MLRLNFYGSIVSSPIEVNRSSRSWIILSNKATIVCRRNIRVKALKDGMNGGTNGSGLGGRSWDPGLEIEVPFEQRPVCSQFIPGLIHLIQSYEETGWYDGQMWVKPPEVSGLSFANIFTGSFLFASSAPPHSHSKKILPASKWIN
uniref:Putative ovule protein n=1 Tax=Solanum chacoense TaxID=4108 RepID=A0A0V0HRA4_SOLCH